MRIFKIILLFPFLIVTSCTSKEAETINVVNDTTSVISFAISDLFRDQELPELEKLTTKAYFKDRILLTSDSLLFNLLPESVGKLKFKILPLEEICNIIRSDSLKKERPNYLFINNLMKTDSGYYLNVESLSCIPFGGGGTVGMEISKQNDTLVVTHRGFSNVN